MGFDTLSVLFSLMSSQLFGSLLSFIGLELVMASKRLFLRLGKEASGLRAGGIFLSCNLFGDFFFSLAFGGGFFFFSLAFGRGFFSFWNCLRPGGTRSAHASWGKCLYILYIIYLPRPRQDSCRPHQRYLTGSCPDFCRGAAKSFLF